MLLCPQCRFENPLSNRFCQVCGSLLSADAERGELDSPAEAFASAEPDGGEAQMSSSPATGESGGAVGADPWSDEAEPSGKPFVPMEAFATIPPSQSDYHQSLVPPPSLEQPGQDGSAVSAADLPEQDDAPERQEALIPDGIAGVALEMTRESVESEPMEEAWDESTVWNGSGDDDGDDDSPTMILPMQLARLDCAGVSHVGRQRDHNEDNFNTHTEIAETSGMSGQTFSAKGLYILCDGMGGHSGGEVASAMVVEELKRFFAEHWTDRFPDRATIRAAIASANHVVYEANESDERLGNGRMGTTLVLVLIQGTQVAFAHVGDSRLYTYSRREGLLQRTVDHEVGQLEVMRGVDPEIAYGRPESYQLTQALGPKDEDFINPGVEFMELQEDTLFLLCSDGLSDYSLVEDHAEEKVAPLLGSRAILDQGVSDLVHLANELSGHDNITAVVIRAKVRPDSKALA